MKPDNRAVLVAVVATGRVAPARLLPETAQPSRDGVLRLLPGTGGVALGLHSGDPLSAASADVADHALPGASVEADGTLPAHPGDLHLLACVGNDVLDEDGTWLGRVAGKRGGLAPGFWGPHLLSVEAAEERLRALVPGRQVAVHTVGRGLALTGAPEVALVNCSPWLLDALPLIVDSGAVTVPVRAVVPSRLAGAGLGQDSWIGDLEVTRDDGLPPDLAFGDLVAFTDVDGTTSRHHRVGWTSVGLVSHGSSTRPGHGVGITLLASGPDEALRVRPADDAGVGRALRDPPGPR